MTNASCTQITAPIECVIY